MAYLHKHHAFIEREVAKGRPLLALARELKCSLPGLKEYCDRHSLEYRKGRHKWDLDGYERPDYTKQEDMWSKLLGKGKGR